MFRCPNSEKTQAIRTTASNLVGRCGAARPTRARAGPDPQAANLQAVNLPAANLPAANLQAANLEPINLWAGGRGPGVRPAGPGQQPAGPGQQPAGPGRDPAGRSRAPGIPTFAITSVHTRSTARSREGWARASVVRPMPSSRLDPSRPCASNPRGPRAVTVPGAAALEDLVDRASPRAAAGAGSPALAPRRGRRCTHCGCSSTF